MATPKKRRRSSGAQRRPLVPLLLVLGLIVVLTGGMLLTGANTPRLGIDLAGGTSITLTAKEEDGKKDAVNEANMNTAASIIDRRVNGLGVSEAEVTTQGERNIIVNIPRGTDEKQAREQVGTTAELGFRPVLAAAPATPPAEKPGAGEESPGTGDDADKGDKGDADKGDADASASPGPSPQGGTAREALTADDSPSPSPSPGDKEKPDEQEDPPAQGDGGVSEAVGKEFESLSCTSQKSRSQAGQDAAQADAKDTVVACDQDGASKFILGPLAVPGTNVDGASAVFNQQRGQWVVNVEFTSAGSKKFADTTSRISSLPQPQNQFAISLDGEVVSAPSVSQRISGSAEISGSFQQEEAQDLANVLKFGALPLSFEESNVLSISPTLGGEQLKAGLIAGAIGMALVIAYLLFYYRALGMVAVLSLLAMGAFTYVVMTLLGPAVGFALSLPAVCGAIVAIGITADSFIVYFERIRDEVREGRSVRSAIERAWPRARHTIIISDVVSFLAAVVLFFAAVGSVQGFAFVLGLTTLLDVLVVFLITKPLTSLLVSKPFFGEGHPWSGLDAKRLGARPPVRGRRRGSVTAEPKEA
ncbi:protein translocase subunit SecD [Streptomyces sp. P38-E01]|uniref:Protein translocase subunit SecD n=1 Tax=Streptomyces tardus TaxID=2780544 RepID=A0A949N7C0_9ACTN|nr:protein translocase subunit SecD [Streptomyces tardus]MBU7599962.1 protein translocase subunit SecD [Streptomyces tardus]